MFFGHNIFGTVFGAVIGTVFGTVFGTVVGTVDGTVVVWQGGGSGGRGFSRVSRVKGMRRWWKTECRIVFNHECVCNMVFVIQMASQF
jgi:uncharacterized protein YcfJ